MEDHAGIAVEGHHALLYPDDALSSSLASEQHLLTWSGERVDRFDVRLLLDGAGSATGHSTPADAEVEEQLLDFERYRDLSAHEAAAAAEASDNEEEDEEPELPAPPQPSAAAGFNAVGFDYHVPQPAGQPGQAAAAAAAGLGLAAESLDAAADAGRSVPAAGGSRTAEAAAQPSKEPPFVPAVFIPARLHRHLPSTERMHKVIAQTARFTREAGGQTEFVLRVKQRGNPNFAFLEPDNVLHPYFRWLVATDPKDFVRLPAAAPPVLDEEPQQQEQLAAEPGSNADAAAAPIDSAPAVADEQQPDGQQTEAGPAEAAQAAEAPEQLQAGQHSELQQQLHQQGLPASNAAAAAWAATASAQMPMRPGFPPLPLPLVPGMPLWVPHGMPLPLLAPHALAMRPRQREGSSEPQVPGLDGDAAAAGRTGQSGEPPAEICGIIAKLVHFIKKAGPQFEATVRIKEQGNPRFGFLLPWSPFNAYYRQQLLAALGDDAAQPLLEGPMAVAKASPAEATADEAAATGEANAGATTGEAAAAAAAAADKDAEELHQQAAEAIPSAQAAQELGAPTLRPARRRFHIHPNPALPGATAGPKEASKAADAVAGEQPAEAAGAAADGTASDAAAAAGTAEPGAEPGAAAEAPAEPEELGFSMDAVLEAQRAVAQEKQRDAEVSSEQRLEQRRRMAREMLAAKRLAAAQADDEARRAQQQQTLAAFRQSLSIDSDEEAQPPVKEEPEPGEIQTAPLITRTAPLPPLETLLQPRQDLVTAAQGEHEVRHQAVLDNPNGGLQHDGSSDSGGRHRSRRHRRSRRRHADSDQQAAEGDGSEGEARERKRQRRSKRHHAEGKRESSAGVSNHSEEAGDGKRHKSSQHKRKQRKGSAERSGSEGQRKRIHRSRSPADASLSSIAPVDLRARVRAMLGH